MPVDAFIKVIVDTAFQISQAILILQSYFGLTAMLFAFNYNLILYPFFQFLTRSTVSSHLTTSRVFLECENILEITCSCNTLFRE